jgi:hypothetical protein
METKNTKGGKRNNAGRKPAKDPKKTIVLYVERSCILKFGSEEKLKQQTYLFFANYENEEIKKQLPIFDNTKELNTISAKPLKFTHTDEKIITLKDVNYFYQKMKTLDKDDLDAVMKLSDEANESLALNFNEKRTIRMSLQNGTY